MKSQKDCVYESVINYFQENGIKFEGGRAKDIIDTEGRKIVHQIIFDEFKSGNVVLKKEMDDEQLRTYIPGLLSNHLRKDTRLNGGKPYEPENPGMLTGNSDPQIREMRKALKIVKGTDKEAIIQAGLDKLVTEWKKANKKEVEVDISLLPEEYRALVG